MGGMPGHRADWTAGGFADEKDQAWRFPNPEAFSNGLH